MHEHFYVIQLLIEADVIEVPPPNHISNKSEGAGLDNCAGKQTYLQKRLTPHFIVVCALTFECPNL